MNPYKIRFHCGVGFLQETPTAKKLKLNILLAHDRQSQLQVMDALSILARSRRRSQKLYLHTAGSSAIPSAGVAIGPESHDRASKGQPASNDNFRSSKRQRTGLPQTDTLQVPKHLDFFSDESKAVRVAQKTVQHAPGGTNGHETRPEQDTSHVDAGQCKKILRSHKIKIVQLWPSVQPTDGAFLATDKRKANTSATDGVQSSKRRKLELYPNPLDSFAQMHDRYGLSRTLVNNVIRQGYRIPTEVQLGSLPLLLDTKQSTDSSNTGRDIRQDDLGIDLLTVAPTGSGKTLAFLIPVVHALVRGRRATGDERHGPRAVIIAPTKELASQIVNEGRKLLLGLGVKITFVRKGMQIDTASAAPSQDADDEIDGDVVSADSVSKTVPLVKADILVSTPLALLHALDPKDTSALDTVTYLVLDEADVLLDPLFRQQTVNVWSACTNSRLRVSLWSATMGASIETLATELITARWERMRQVHKLQARDRSRLVRLVVGMKDSSLPTIEHKLLYAANEQGKLMALRQLLHPSRASNVPALRPPFLVFTQTIARATALHAELLYDIPHEAGGSSRIAVLHSDLSDTARESTMTRFRRGEIWVLITTDLLSRGVDFKGINGVVNYDFPNSSAAYVHRVGRTGRAGREGGVAVTLYAKEDIPFVKNVANVIVASERQRDGGGGDVAGSTEAQKWLFDALPTPTKREKQQLKKRGVESRRGGDADNGVPKKKRASSTRISTKAGYERKLSNRKFSAGRNATVVPPPPVLDDFDGFDD